MSRASWGAILCEGGRMELPYGNCPNAAEHTPQPAGYAEFFIWAEKMRKDGWRQHRCPGCDRLVILKRAHLDGQTGGDGA